MGVVYLDRCDKALQRSAEEGRRLLPNAWHRPIKANLYDPTLIYPVDGIEVSTSFGLTLMNIEGDPCGSPPKDFYTQNLASIRKQMHKGAHLLTTFDHNQDTHSVERAYSSQSDFAKDMLLRTKCMDANSVDFIVRLHKKSQTLSHGFRFKKAELVVSRSGAKQFNTGDILWFNNSVKASKTEVMNWNKSSGFFYARADIPMDSQNHLGWHHLLA